MREVSKSLRLSIDSRAAEQVALGGRGDDVEVGPGGGRGAHAGTGVRARSRSARRAIAHLCVSVGPS